MPPQIPLPKSWPRSIKSAGLGNVPIDTNLPPPEPIDQFNLENLVCHESLGGLLRHYERRAA